MVSSNRCATQQELCQLLSEDAKALEQERWSEHLEHCLQCQSVLATLAAPDNLWEESRQQFTEYGSPTESFSDTVESVLAHYRVEGTIGYGGMATVYRGFDPQLHRPVAIKVLHSHLARTGSSRQRFFREAQSAAAIAHPNVIPIYGVHQTAGKSFLVMPLITGGSLQQRIDREGPICLEDMLRIALQISEALNAAHTRGVIHRDVKPANILLDGNTLRVVLSDFGLARMVDDASMTRTGIVTGTPHYMSPEQAGGETIDCRSDLFSLGCVLWFMLTGRPPFRAATAMGVLNKICHTSEGDIRSINPQVPVPLAAIVVKLLNKSAAGRFQSAQEVEQALNEVLSDWQSGSFQRADQSSRRRQVIGWALAACLCIAVVGTAGWRLLATRGAATQANRLPSIQLNAGQALPLGTLGNTSNQQVFPSPLGQSLSQQLRTDPWYQRFEKLATDVQILENRDTDGMESRAWLNRSFLQPEATTKEINATLDAIEKDSAAWQELIKSSQY